MDGLVSTGNKISSTILKEFFLSKKFFSFILLTSSFSDCGKASTNS